ncbi:hypothetical protein [Phenylobacterium zucineum]|uniref:hypothetical protein n=1 Tax=Phenylobacterium zucineum TaxID=284016 RepID=UPI0002E0CE20|nr:hypothetical protein [Phenylobacterium zucineum]
MRDLVFRGAARQAWRPASSIACLAFVALLAVAFWAGAVRIVQAFLPLASMGF